VNAWYSELIELALLASLGLGAIILSVLWIAALRRHGRAKLRGILLLTDVLALTGVTAFVLTHPTYYKYNDRRILHADIHEVAARYGDFDWGSVQEGKAGKVGYYLYTDNGPIMPDHLKHYYWIRYDETGTVFEVCEGVQPGG
jgi:hypothetical protein